MFGSRIVNKAIYDTLSATPGLTAIVGTRIHRGVAYPPGTQLPALLFYMEQSAYDAGQLAGAEHIDGEELRYTVRLDDAGTSDARIAQAAQAQLEALAGRILDLPDGTQVTFHATGEVPMSGGYVDGDTFYQRLGTIYNVTVTRG